jgi:hypothetical protein
LLRVIVTAITTQMRQRNTFRALKGALSHISFKMPLRPPLASDISVTGERLQIATHSVGGLGLERQGIDLFQDCLQPELQLFLRPWLGLGPRKFGVVRQGAAIIIRGFCE